MDKAILAAERGAKLTSQLLAFSRRNDLVTKPVDVDRLISTACEMLPRTIGPTIVVKVNHNRDTWLAMTCGATIKVRGERQSR